MSVEQERACVKYSAFVHIVILMLFVLCCFQTVYEASW
jgi:hypothetical protein